MRVVIIKIQNVGKPTLLITRVIERCVEASNEAMNRPMLCAGR